MTERNRQAAGQPTGGQFAPTTGSDAGLDLDSPSCTNCGDEIEHDFEGVHGLCMACADSTRICEKCGEAERAENYHLCAGCPFSPTTVLTDFERKDAHEYATNLAGVDGLGQVRLEVGDEDGEALLLRIEVLGRHYALLDRPGSLPMVAMTGSVYRGAPLGRSGDLGPDLVAGLVAARHQALSRDVADDVAAEVRSQMPVNDDWNLARVRRRYDHDAGAMRTEMTVASPLGHQTVVALDGADGQPGDLMPSSPVGNFAVDRHQDSRLHQSRMHQVRQATHNEPGRADEVLAEAMRLARRKHVAASEADPLLTHHERPRAPRTR